jgi:hypothetical protein
MPVYLDIWLLISHFVFSNIVDVISKCRSTCHFKDKFQFRTNNSFKNFNQLIVLTSSDQDFSYMHDREKFTNKTNHVGKHGTEIGKLLEA